MPDISSLLNELYHLPKWKVQKDYVDRLVIEDPKDWLIEVNKIFSKIPSDRKDKFYYLVDVLSLNITDMDFVCSLSEIRDYIVCNNISKFDKEDLLKYICEYEVYNIKLFKGIDFDREEVKKILKRDKVKNRDLLYSYIK
ncbi:hypothetical protein P3W45_001072 [Vairimorpha bombi]|jgi:hypothetical protein